jgi:hypothetical protein
MSRNTCSGGAKKRLDACRGHDGCQGRSEPSPQQAETSGCLSSHQGKGKGWDHRLRHQGAYYRGHQQPRDSYPADPDHDRRGRDYALAFAIPVDTKGVTLVFSRQTNDTRRLDGILDAGNPKYGIVGGEAVIFFKDVFVPGKGCSWPVKLILQPRS